METLIELYDERPLENVLGVEMFHPKTVVYVCPDQLASTQSLTKKLRSYFLHRGLTAEPVFRKTNVYHTESVLMLLRQIVRQYPDCALDITGGTDAVLFAAGRLSAENPLPVFTYSRRQNCFYNIQNADFAAALPCDVSFSVEDCFLMAGGAMRTGRVDNSILSNYMNDIDPFFRIYLKNRRNWLKIVTYFQRISPADSDGYFPLSVSGRYVVKGERASRISAPESALHELEGIGFLQDLQIKSGESVSFRFRDAQIRSWLRDVGSVLELYIYKACLDTGLFDDVITSAVVVWEGSTQKAKRNDVSNELDVMCTRGITPVFISCKTSDVKTEALNELAILRDRFGGQIARAAIVTAEKGGAAMRNRAFELGIDVIDLNDLIAGRTDQRLHSLMRPMK